MDLVVGMRQKESFGKSQIGLDEWHREHGMSKMLVCPKVQRSLGYFLASLRACSVNVCEIPRASLALLSPSMVAKTIGVQKNSLGELIAHVRRSNRRPWVLVDVQTLQFWRPNMTRGWSRRCRRGS